jgi:hypothetical protein
MESASAHDVFVTFRPVMQWGSCGGRSGLARRLPIAAKALLLLLLGIV